jgi:putative DNA primase/helicase
VGIFSDNAPLYWAVGLNAIPLWRNAKNPNITSWQKYANEPVSGTDQADWLRNFPEGNMGLVLGPQSGLVMIDIDTEDPVVIGLLTQLLPPSPWSRVGRKGYALAYKWSGEKTFRIKRADGSMVVEHLSERTQLVLPPSIHPDTKQPYTANAELCDPAVLGAVMTLPPGFEAILRRALEDAGVELSLSGHTRVTDYIATGSRDVQMIAVCGHFASGVLRGELTFNEALGRLVAWHDSCIEKLAGDDIDVSKGLMKIASFILTDVLGPKRKSLPTGWDNGLTVAERTNFGFDQITEENIAWDYERMKVYIREMFMLHEPDTAGRRTAVDYLIEKIAGSVIDKVDEDRLLKYVVSAGGLGGLSGLNHAEIADALIKDMEKVGKISFSGGFFWQWKGSHWDKLETSDVRHWVANEFGHLPAAKKSNDYNGIISIAADAVRADLQQVPDKGVNFANGFLDMNLVLRAHHPDYGCTYTLPYRYMPEMVGQAKKFEDFLYACWGRDVDFEDKRSALQEAMATTMFAVAPQLQRAFCLHGPPSSGKSQMLKIVTAMFPAEVVSAVPPEDWGDKFLPAQLYGKLLNVCGELHEHKNIDGKSFKEIVSGEQLTAQRKNGQPFEFTPNCAHWFASNHTPKTTDTSSAFNRRWLLLIYNSIVNKNDKVLDLGTLIVADEREQIASWAVEGITRVLKAKDYTLPESHVQRIAEVAAANNSIRSFLVDSGLYTVELSSSIPISEMTLYNAYYTFASMVGVAKPVQLSGFRQKMRELSYELGFHLRMENYHGGTGCSYLKLIPVKNNVVDLRKSNLIT